MKKTFIILPIIAGAIFLGGCGNKGDAPKMPVGNTTVPEKNVEAPEENSIVGNLKEMVGMGKKMVCVSTENGVETRIYIEGKKYRSVTATKEGTTNSIFDGETFYSWDEGKRMPIKMTMSCMEEISKNMPKAEGKNSPGFESTDKLIEEKSNQNCKEATENVDFSIPADIAFTDQCLMMQNLTKNLKDGGLPKDFKMPTE